jgi:hypothetical protein
MPAFALQQESRQGLWGLQLKGIERIGEILLEVVFDAAGFLLDARCICGEP